MNKVADNKLSSVKSYFIKELKAVFGDREARLFFEACAVEWLGLSKSDMIIGGDVSLTESQLLRFLYAIKDFKKHIPLGHVLGKSFFYGMDLLVTADTLIPRPETEELVALIMDCCPSAMTILDIGTGSGCIALALKKELSSSEVTGVDVSTKALAVAAKNADVLSLNVKFLELDILEDSSTAQIASKWDVIVSNPPYISNSERVLMSENVLGKDPDLALFVSDDDPLLFYRTIGQFALNHLSEKGTLFFEINENNGKSTCELLHSLGFTMVELKKDLQMKDRMIVAQI